MSDKPHEQVENRLYADALRRATQNYEELIGDLSVLRKLNDSFQADLDFKRICEKLVEVITDAMNVENASVMVMDHETGELRLLAGKSFWEERGSVFSDGQWSGKTFKLGEGTVGQVARQRKSILIHDTLSDPRFVNVEEQKVSVRSILSVPLLHGDRLHGVLNLSNSEPGAFSVTKEHTLNIMASAVSVALSRALLIEELKRNIKELQETRHRLIQSDKLALLGEMLSGVAHEVNNPLAAIMGYSELILNDGSLSQQNQEWLRRMVQCVERSKKILQGLLSFARKTELEKKQVDIYEVIDRALEHRAYDFGVNGIEVVKNYETDELAATVDPNQMEQVFLNLVNNAFDSMVDRGYPGKLEIRTQLIDGPAVRVEFLDTGFGIKETDREKIFEPFFTTKEVGKGTGLGLSVSYGIVKEHGGSLFLDTDHREGAKFVVTLPIVRTPPGAAASPSQDRITPGHELRGRILVVDDEEVITEFMSAILSSDGFVVDCASDGEDAFKMLKASRYDLVITDLKMPGALDGRDLFLQLARDNPRLAERFVFITGDIMETQTSKFLKESGRAFLLKPFAIKDLRRVVYRTLKEAGSLK